MLAAGAPEKTLNDMFCKVEFHVFNVILNQTLKFAIYF